MSSGSASGHGKLAIARAVALGTTVVLGLPPSIDDATTDVGCWVGWRTALPVPAAAVAAGMLAISGVVRAS